MSDGAVNTKSRKKQSQSAECAWEGGAETRSRDRFGEYIGDGSHAIDRNVGVNVPDCGSRSTVQSRTVYIAVREPMASVSTPITVRAIPGRPLKLRSASRRSASAWSNGMDTVAVY